MERTENVMNENRDDGNPMSPEAFSRKVQEILGRIDPEKLKYREDEAWMYQASYQLVEAHAYERQLLNTAIALPLVRGLVDGIYRGTTLGEDGLKHARPFAHHCMVVGRLLVDLQVPLSRDEEDILLASALCHDLIGWTEFERGGRELTEDYFLDPRVYEIVDMVTCRDYETEEEHQAFFDRMQTNKLALLVKITDRSHVVEQLYDVSVWKSREYIYETRTYHLPMAMYGRENYPEIYRALGVLIEKMRLLTQAAGILVDRYETREAELKEEMISLREENLAIRREIQKLERELAQK